MKALSWITTAVLALGLTGCAGGWKNGPPSAATSAAPPPAATSAASTTNGAGATFTWKGEGQAVHVAGDFNDWSTTADALKKQADGTWSITKNLAAGRYAYKFVIDGGTWKEDPNAAETVEDGFGGTNSVIVVAQGAGGATALAAGVAASANAGLAGEGGTTFVWKGEGGAVNVAGDFNDWSTSADALVKQGDGSWALTKSLAPGSYAYKFVIDGGTWKEDPNATETTDDGYGGTNSVVVVGESGGGGGGKAAAAAVTAAIGAGAAAAAGSGDGVTFAWSGEGSSVHVAGEFNEWSTSADALVKQADGSWSLTKKLAPGRYMYKLVIDGGTWKEDPNAAETADDGFGGMNSVVVVGGTAGGETQGGSTGAAAGAAAVGAGAVAAAGATAAARPPDVTADGVRFYFAGNHQSVHLAGDFNDWSTTADPLTKGEGGLWTILMKLESGSHGYKFVVNGSEWKTDPANPEASDDGFGGKNSVVQVK